METVIDSLVVKLGLNTEAFEAGQKRIEEALKELKETLENTSNKVENSGKKAAGFFDKIRSSALKFFAVLTVGRGMTDFTRSVINGGAQLARMSDRLGISADTLSRWQDAVKESGGTAEDALGTMQALSSSLTELQLTGNTGILPYLQMLGVAVADSAGKARPLDAILKDIGEKLRNMPDRANAFNIGRNLGIDDGTLNLLMQSREEFERILAAQKGMSQDDANKALQTQIKFAQIRNKVERATQELVIKMLPYLEKIGDAMARFAETAVPAIAGAIDWFIKLDDATGGWATTLGIALATLRLIGGPGVIGGLGSVLATLTKLSLVGAAGAAGWAIGSKISEKIEGTEASNTIGRTVAKTLAFFGNEEAQDALDAEDRANGIEPPKRNRQPKEAAPEAQDRPGKSPAPGPDGSVEIVTRAQRNNNPGNLEYRGQQGATKEEGEGRFAKFDSAAEGVAALVRQLKKYAARGLDTVREIIATYAPSNENDTQGYIAALSKKLGVGADQQLNLEHAETLAGLVKGISQHEGGKWLSDQDLLSGLQLAGINRPQQQAQNMSIGEIKVYTQASDANGIARDIGAALVRQADTGMR